MINGTIILVGLLFLFMLFYRSFKSNVLKLGLKNNFLKDWPIDWLLLLVMAIIIIFDIIKGENIKLEILIYIILSILTFVFYRFKGPGIYNTGVNVRSFFYRWKDIYAIKETQVNDKIKIILYTKHFLNSEQLLPVHLKIEERQWDTVKAFVKTKVKFID